MKYLSIFLLLFSSCHFTKNASNLYRFELETYKMGTKLSLIFYDKNKEVAQENFDEVIQRVDELELIFSDYIENSEASRLSATAGSGQMVKVSDEMWQVLTFANQISEKSEGAFDVTIGGLSKLWRKAIRQKELPSKKEVEKKLATVDYQSILFFEKEQAIQLTKKGTRLDFGGIAKGFALDEVMRILKKRNIESALIDFGGDILVSAPPPQKKGWLIYFKQNETKTKIFSHKAIATSGKQFRYLNINGQIYSHIIHPKTGWGIQHHVETTVIANDGMTADALASTVNVLNQQIDWKDTEIYLTTLSHHFERLDE